MSDRTVGYPPGLAEGVAGYVSGVRAELADLPVEEVDDLTGGMEADLSELAAECGGDLAGRLGSPTLYAAELRSAAGLPERVAGSGGRRRPLAEALTHARSSFAMLTDQHPGLRSVTAFLVTLRPAWWLIRGYLLALGLWSVLNGSMRGVRPHGVLQYVMALAAIVVSVQLGRGWSRRTAVLGPLLVLANTAAVIVGFMASVSGEGSYYYAGSYSSPPGVSLDGQQVDNIFAYDADGKRISGVRLFAQDGRPLDADLSIPLDANGNPTGLDGSGEPIGIVRDSSGAQLRNVYPRVLVGSDPWQVTDPTDPTYAALHPPLWSPPMSIVPLTPSATGTPTSTATATTPAVTPTSEPVRPKPAPPKPSSVPSPSVTRSGR